MAFEPFTGLMNALAGIAGDVSPLINDAVAQKYEKQFQDSIAAYNACMAATPYNPDALNALLLQFDNDSGTAIAGLSDCAEITVPTVQFSALYQQARYSVFLIQTLTRLQSLKTGTQ